MAGFVFVIIDQKKLTYDFCSSSVFAVHFEEFLEEQPIIEQWQFVYSNYR